MSNPYSTLRSLLDSTRPLAPEEMAELMLEQGYIERAVAIYDRLVLTEPHNAAYRTRREWLQRLVAVQARPIRPVTGVRRVGVKPVPSVDQTLRGAALRGADAPGIRDRAGVRRAPTDRAAAASVARKIVAID